ncbi:MAG TPA: glycosyltransferase [Thermoanaerobaculia bacterium]|jgi:spore maturation protein CgeB|nr:glycosyltransferase [Thermoanaerobaculia bacterium]
MRVAFFVHSLLADWKHGSSHFLRGIATELIARGHEVLIFEPRQSLIAGQGAETLAGFRAAYPKLASQRYDSAALDLDRALEGASLVIVHEWSDPVLSHRIGHHRRHGGAYRLLFHDTHHRAVTHPAAFSAYSLADYDGVLTSGAAVRDLYLKNGWARAAWTWHGAADTRVFYPRGVEDRAGDLVWVGNWGDDERSELREYLTGPVHELGLFARVYGGHVRAVFRGRPAGPAGSGHRLCRLGAYEVPRILARFAVTVSVPRRPQSQAPPTQLFEALACGIPLVSAPWDDAEGLFRPGQDFLLAHNGEEMKLLLRELLDDPALGVELARSGRETLLSRHTCAHRVNELLEVYRQVQ